MKNENQAKKDGIVLHYSVLLAIIWFVATYWLHIELIEGLFVSWGSLLAGIAVLLGLPAYLISIFMKRYNRLYVKCRMNVRKASINDGIIYGAASYAVMFVVVYVLLGIDASGIFSTAALVIGCAKAYLRLKKSADAEHTEAESV